MWQYCLGCNQPTTENNKQSLHTETLFVCNMHLIINHHYKTPLPFIFIFQKDYLSAVSLSPSWPLLTCQPPVYQHKPAEQHPPPSRVKIQNLLPSYNFKPCEKQHPGSSTPKPLHPTEKFVAGDPTKEANKQALPGTEVLKHMLGHKSF